MDYIKGKIRKIIYQNDNGYSVALFRIKETNDEELKDLVNKTITITGVLLDANMEETFILYGEYVNNERFGFQYTFKSYEKVKPTDESAVVEYLSSSLIKGCGEKTAIKIVETLGKNAIEIIKENPEVLRKVKGLTVDKAEKIYNSIIANQSVDDIIIKLKSLGFSMNEASKIYNKNRENTLFIVENNIYLLKEIIDFNKLDNIFLANHDLDNDIRIEACILEGMQRLSNSSGDVYYFNEEIKKILSKDFRIIDSEKIDVSLEKLIIERKVIKEEDKYYLKEYYDMESDIAYNLLNISNYPLKDKYDLDDEIRSIEHLMSVTYNEEQKNAIRNALNNRVTIISGGPGTGKTTIINAIVKLYTKLHCLNPLDVYQTIALLAPTGRASRKMSLSTSLPAMTIHRYLKWNKDTNSFGVNEYNKNYHRLVIVDEVSMIDVMLFDALLKGISSNIQLILVGDSFQLPSVGAGLVLNDLIESDMFNFCPLKHIYRQSSDSYIPYLARDIKEKEITEEILIKKDDYNFLNTPEQNIKSAISQICKMSLEKGLKEDDIQILAPLYKTENGIDNLNLVLQDIFNPKKENKKEIKIGDVAYRENDKVLQLVNNPDLNVYNGDIGYIETIKKEFIPKVKDVIIINFEGTRVVYKKEDMFNIKHAYAITIHKSQGSEFPHVIMPVCRGYSKMLYNKLIYTGVSRAKKSLVIVGDITSLKNAIFNDYSTNRKTSLKEKIVYKFMN